MKHKRTKSRKRFFHNQWQKMDWYEREACRRVRCSGRRVARTTANRCEMNLGLRQVYDVPTGVDTEFFRPLGTAREPFELVFTGSMDWMPNEDAIIISSRRSCLASLSWNPQVTLTVVGRNPARTPQSACRIEPANKDHRPRRRRAALHRQSQRIHRSDAGRRRDATEDL